MEVPLYIKYCARILVIRQKVQRVLYLLLYLGLQDTLRLTFSKGEEELRDILQSD